MTDKDDVIRGQEWAGMALMRENERLRAEIEQLKHITDWAEIDGLRAECERLRAAVTDLGALHTQDYVENERLRAEVDMWHRHYAGLLNEAHDENERLRAALAEACDEIESWVDSDDETTTAWRHLLARDME